MTELSRGLISPQNVLVVLLLVAVAALAFVTLKQPLQPPQDMVKVNWDMAAEPTQASGTKDIEITVYNVPQNSYYSGTGFDYSRGLGLVKETRSTLLQTGNNLVSVVGVAQYVDPTSIYFKDLNGKSKVLEQNYDYDLVSEEKLLEKYLDKEISIKADNETVTGTLLSAGGKLVLQTSSGVVSVPAGGQISFPVLPQGLITKPTINWLLYSDSAGEHSFQTSYLTGGLDWRADYVAVANADDTAMDLQGWVSVTNGAGTTFENAKLKLVAGEINLVQGQQPRQQDFMMESKAMAAPQGGGFQEEGLFEYHLYTLQRPTTLKDNEVKQISLLEGQGVPVTKKFVFEPSDSSKVQVKLEFENKESSGLGIPLPKGKVRLYKPDSEGQLQFLGEDAIDHTPKDEKLRLFIGNAFDVVVEKKEKDRANIPGKTGEENCGTRTSYEVVIRNHKDSAVTVDVFETVSYGEWKVVEESLPGEKESASKNAWHVPVSANGEATLTYAIQQTWC